jgi:small GTP-binding protein
VDFKTLNYKHNDRVLGLKMWDTAGQERFQSITRNYYSGAHLIIVFFDVTFQQTFVDVRQWVSSVKDSLVDPPPMLLLGNKKDLTEKRLVQDNTAQNIADVFGASYMTVSAKTGENVADAFMLMIKLIEAAEEKGLYQQSSKQPQEAVTVAKPTKVVKSSSASSGSGCCGS